MSNNEVRERPILFSGPMVRAIIDGTKTQSRRVVRFNPSSGYIVEPGGKRRWHRDDPEAVAGCPYGAPGDSLWVRETWCPGRGLAVVASSRTLMAPAGAALAPGIIYAADGATLPLGCWWRPSIHMPRHFSRLSLRVTGVRVERLHEISEADARAEGVDAVSVADVPRQATLNRRTDFAQLWESINAKRAPWASNPWVWALSFERTT